MRQKTWNCGRNLPFCRDITFELNMEDLLNLKYKELQRLAKAAGIKANSPKAELVTALLAFNNECEAENETENDSDKKRQESEQSEPLGEKLDVVVQNKMNFGSLPLSGFFRYKRIINQMSCLKLT